MTPMYLMTEAQHAQIVASLEATCGGRCNSEFNPCWEYELADRLKAMQPVSPVAWCELNADMSAWFLAYGHNLKATTRPLYTPEQSK